MIPILPIDIVLALVTKYAEPVVKAVGGNWLLETLGSSVIGQTVNKLADAVTSKSLEKELKSATISAVRQWNRDRSPQERKKMDLLNGLLKEMNDALSDGKPLSEKTSGFIEYFTKELSKPSRSKAYEYIQLKVAMAGYQNTSEIKAALDVLNENLDKLLREAGKDGHTEHNLTPDAICRPSENFIGREKEISGLEMAVAEKGNVVITGMGGLGKTELARKLFDGLEEEYDEVAWLTYRGDARNTILTGLNLFRETGDQQERWRLICSKLANDGNIRLMVFDNVDTDDTTGQDPSQDESLRILSGLKDVDIVLTSRGREFRGDYHIFQLREFGDEECVRIFRQYYSGEPSEEDMPVIKEIVGMGFNNTQMVEMFAKQAKYESDLCGYRDKLRKGYDEIKLKIYQGGRHDTVPALMGYMFETDVTEHKDILYGFAALPQASAFSMEELEGWFGYDPSGVDRLAATGWLRFEGGRISMHPLIQKVVAERSKKDGYVRDMTFFRNYLEANYETFLSDQIRYDILSIRIDVITSFGGSIDNPDFPFSPEVLDSLGGAHLVLWHPDMVMKAYRRALNIREDSSAPEADLAVSYNNIANVYRRLGGKENLEESLRYNRKAIEIQERVLSPDSPDLAASYNNIACVYNDLGGKANLEESLRYHRKAIEIKERVLSPDSPGLAASYNNIAIVYIDLGGKENLEESLRYHRKAIEINERVLSPDSPDIASSYNNIACVYNDLGGKTNLEESLRYHRKAIEINERVLSPDSPDIASSYNNIACVYNDLGGKTNLEESLRYHRKAIEIRERVLSPDNPALATSYNNIAYVYNDLGGKENLEIALTYIQKSIVIMEKAFPSGNDKVYSLYNFRDAILRSLELV